MKTVVRRGLHACMHIYGYLLIIATIITVFAALTTIGVSAEVTFDTNYYEYDINHDGKISEDEKGATIIGFNNLSEGETVTIPAKVEVQTEDGKIETKPVLAIGLEGVVTTTNVPGADKIGTLDLTQATNLKVILPYAFYSCKNLKGEIKSNTVEEVRDQAFMSCTELTSFSALKVTTVGRCAFDGCTRLTNLNLPALKTVEPYAFDSCKELTSLSLSELETVGNSAFSGCEGLTRVDLPELETVGDWAFGDCTELTSFSAPNLTTVGTAAFSGCEGLTSLYLPALETVGDWAFGDCTGLTSFSAPKVTTVGGYAFYGCTGLTNLNLPALKTVGPYAFGDCTGLTSFSAPKVTTVGAYAFNGCTGLENIYLSYGCKSPYNAFAKVPDTCWVNGDLLKTYLEMYGVNYTAQNAGSVGFASGFGAVFESGGLR